MPGANDRGGWALLQLGLVVSILIHGFLALWASGSFVSGHDLSTDEAIAVQLVPAETAPPPPRLPPEPEPDTPEPDTPEPAASKTEPADAPAPGEEQQAVPAAGQPADAPAPTEGQAAPLSAPSSAPAESASLGKAGADDPTELSKEEQDGLYAQAKFCWNVPSGWTDRRQVTVTVRFLLNRDGTLKGAPVAVEFPASPLGKAAADSAVEAILACSPFGLPAEKYDQWKDVQLRLSP